MRKRLRKKLLNKYASACRELLLHPVICRIKLHQLRQRGKTLTTNYYWHLAYKLAFDPEQYRLQVATVRGFYKTLTTTIKHKENYES